MEFQPESESSLSLSGSPRSWPVLSSLTLVLIVIWDPLGSQVTKLGEHLISRYYGAKIVDVQSFFSIFFFFGFADLFSQ